MEATPSGAVNSLFSRPVGLPYSTSADHNVRDAALLGPSKGAASQASTVHFQWLAHVHNGVGRGEGGLNRCRPEIDHRGGGRLTPPVADSGKERAGTELRSPVFLRHFWQNGRTALPRDLFTKGDSQTCADFPDLPHPGRRQRGAKEALLKGLPSQDLREASQGFLTCMGVHH